MPPMSTLFSRTCRAAPWLALLLAGQACAVVRLPAVLSDHMVLQRAAGVPVWGWAAPGETVAVSMGAQTERARADAGGAWRVELDTRQAGAAALTVTVLGEHNDIVISDVLVGEVWLAAGQSNMEKPLGEMRGQQPTFDAEAETAAANYPQIRLFKVTRARAATPAADVRGAWMVCSPASLQASQFSAAGYYFARRLHQQLQRPVGVIDASWGGTRIEAWTPAAEVAALEAGEPGIAMAGSISTNFNGMIAPLAPFALKGVIWYQGESNIIAPADGHFYTPKMAALVRSWRAQWRQDFPFLYAQVAPHLYSVVRKDTVTDPEAAPRLREAQTDALRIAGTGMIVTTDLVDDVRDIHPRDKKSVGVRFADLALNGTYQRSDVAAYGPVFRSMQVEGAEALLAFDYADGLATRDGKPVSFVEIAGADGRYVAASASIRNGQLVATSAAVARPVTVRFGWHEAAQPNLVNAAGLPAMPFRSDHRIMLGSAPNGAAGKPGARADAAGKPIRVILVGDSTMASRSGYGDALCQRFKPEVACHNLGRGGRSTSSYRKEGRWKDVTDLLAKGDADGAPYGATYVLVQFGHNDQPDKGERATDLATEFPANLARYADEAQAMGATAVLVTPLTRRTFKAALLNDNLGPWAQATRQVASAKALPLIDLYKLSTDAVQQMGQDEADTLAPKPRPPGWTVNADGVSVEPPGAPKSGFDRTHLGAKGGALFSAMVLGELQHRFPSVADSLR